MNADAPTSSDRTRSQWLMMLALNAMLMIALYIYKLLYNIPGEVYTQLLADYHFGFIKRALLGALTGLLFPTLPVWSPYVHGTLILLVTCGLFFLAFRKIVGFRAETLPVLVFTAGSPVFLKNFIQTLGYFDIYGCAAALLLLIVPATSLAYIALAAVLAVLLNLIHHIQTLLYLPTIIAIVVVRFYLVQRRRISLADVLLGGGLLALIGGLFLYTQLYGNVPVPREEFTAYLQSRISDPAFRSYLSTDIYYNTLAKEISHTWTILPKNLLRLPVYAAIIACHAPLIACFLNSMRQLDTGSRRFILVALTLITLAYLIVFAIVFDYARWYSNWATCMILMFFTMQYLATTRSSIADTPAARRFGWITSLIPRVGTTIPF